MKKKRILLLNTTFKFEGPNDVLWQLVRNVDRDQFEIVMACMHEGGPMEETYRREGFETVNFGMESFTDLGAVKRVKRYVSESGVDLTMAQLLRAEVFGGMGVWLAKKPLVLVIQNIDAYRAKPWHLKKYYLSRLSMQWPRRIVAASDYVRQYVIAHQGVNEEKVLTIHNGVDHEQFLPLRAEREGVRREMGFNSRDVVIGTVARYDEQKGLEYLIDAFEDISAERAHVRLVLVGDGPLRQKLEHAVSKKGIEGRVVFTGFRRDYDRLMQGFDVFALPSLWEGLPLALMAAMASGQPVVATTVSGIPEVVHDGENGFLVPPGDSEALKRRLEILIDAPELRARMGESAQQRIRNSFSNAAMTEKYQELWNEMLPDVSEGRTRKGAGTP